MRQKLRSFPKKENFTVLTVKSAFLRSISPAVSVFMLVQMGASQVSGGLEDGCQVWLYPVV